MDNEQVDYILNNFSAKTKQEIADTLGIPISKVQWQLRKANVSKWVHVDWSKEDINVLEAVYPVSGSKPCAIILGRPYKAVQKKANELGIKRVYTYHYVDGDGYLVTRKNRNDSAKRVHRIIMEAYIGRQLTDDEVVHHIDLNKLNNNLNNLVILTRAEHARLHAELRAQGIRDSLG